MARIRSLKPEAFQSESLAEVSVYAERTFFGLSTQVDDRGRIADKPAVINGALWPLRPEHSAVELEGELQELECAGLVCRYVGCDGRRYLHLVTWDQHQRVDRPSKSRLAKCPEHGGEDYCGKHEGDCPTREPSPNPCEDSRVLDAGSRTVDRGSRTVDQKKASPSSSEIASRPPDAAPKTRPEIERLCTHLADRIEANGNRRPTVGKKWRDAARLMLDRDGRTEEQIHGAIDWCQNDEFWRRNVLSMPKLRDQYDRLRMQAESQRNRAPGAVVPIDRRQQAIDDLFDRAMQRARALDAMEAHGEP